ncbi:MAG: TonB-dependent receptor plug domain-containing protein [Bacteroidota bacterium]
MQLLKLCLLLALLSSTWSSQAQEVINLNGYIREASSLESIPDAQIVEQNSGRSTQSNQYGYFSLQVPRDSIRLWIAAPGKQRQMLGLDLKADTTIEITLSPYTLQTVEIVEESPLLNQAEMSTISLSIKEIEKIPAFLGEVDILKAVQLLPGVQSGNEGSNGLYVRGGGPDQNLILLDGVPLYYVNHLGGFFSVFNADALQSVKLVKGGFPARYGGRLSSVLDITMKEGHKEEYHGAGNIGLIASKLSFEGPIQKGKSSFIVSARRSYLGLLLAPLSEQLNLDRESFGYHFYDFNLKVNHTFSPKDRLYASYYAGDDVLRIQEDFESGVPDSLGYIQSRFRENKNWGNQIAALRWNHLWNPKLFSNLSLTYSRYRYRSESEINEEFTIERDSQLVVITRDGELQFQSRVEDLGLKLDFDAYPHPSHHLRFGGQLTSHNFQPGVQGDTSINRVAFQAEAIPALEGNVYLEDEWQWGSRFRALMGVHAAGYRVRGQNFYSLQPRLSLHYRLGPKVAIKASYAQMTQFLHLLTTSSVGLPVDLWIPATPDILPQQSWQAAVGAVAAFGDGAVELSVEAYYKEMSGLVEYKEGTNFFVSPEELDWEDRVEVGGTGEAYGAEVLLRKTRGKTTGWVGYTLSWNWRQFNNINGGLRFPYRYDRRHDLSVVVSHAFGERWSISGSFVYGTGNAVTLPSGRHPSFSPPVGIGFLFPTSTIDYSFPSFGQQVGSFRTVTQGGGVFGGGVDTYENGRNGFRMQAYHRLDLGVQHSKPTRWGERTWSLSLYNAYNRRNPYSYLFRNEFSTTTGRFSGSRLTKISLFPIIPSLNYAFKF